MSMKLVNQSVICVGETGTPATNCCFPSVARLPGGTHIASWRAGSGKDSIDGSLMLSRSTDDGCTWSTAQEITLGLYAEMPGEAHYGPLTVLGPDHVLAAVMWVDRSAPELPFFHPHTEGLLPVLTLFCESLDGGHTWDNYREMDLAPYHSPMPITGPVLKLADGRLACQFEVNKNYEETRPWRHAAAWKVSSDGGHTWPDHVETAHDPTGRYMYWDAHYALNPNGFCLATFWTYDRERRQDANIHLSISSDNGHRWSSPRDTGIAGQVCHPILLENNRLLLVYVDRFHSQSIRAVLSDDLGETFHSETVVYQHRGRHHNFDERSVTANYLQEMDRWTFGRVDGLVEPNGSVSLIYYAGNSEATSIHWARLAIPSTVRKRHDPAEVVQNHHAPKSQQVRSS